MSVSMMGGYGSGFTSLLLYTLIIGLVILVYLWIVELWREVFKKPKIK